MNLNSDSARLVESLGFDELTWLEANMLNCSSYARKAAKRGFDKVPAMKEYLEEAKGRSIRSLGMILFLPLFQSYSNSRNSMEYLEAGASNCKEAACLKIARSLAAYPDLRDNAYLNLQKFKSIVDLNAISIFVKV